MSDFTRAIHLDLDPDDPTELEVGRMIRLLGRGHLKLWVLKMVRLRCGHGDAAAMANALRQDLIGNLEDGHKRAQKVPKKDRLERPAPSEPIGKQPPSEPLGRKPSKEDDPLKKATKRHSTPSDPDDTAHGAYYS